MKFKLIMIVCLAGIFLLAKKSVPFASAAGIVWILVYVKYHKKS